MTDNKSENNSGGEKNLEEDEATEVQKKIEEEISEDEKDLEGDELSAELSKDRTHMSEHRTKMSEHRTNLSEHRTGLSEHRTDLSEKRTGMSEHRTELSDERTTLSYQRTELSYERTLMSWIRTATSMISFGFTIYKVFEEIVEKQGAAKRIFTPRIVGMAMILFGFLGLLLAQIQHFVAIRKLKKNYPDVQVSISSILGVLILVFGLLLFLGALFRQ
jgi:putative membrane protein